MAEETLITALEEDARAQVRRIIDEAREAAEAILREAALDAEREKVERILSLERRLKSEKAAVLNAARTKASGEKLGVRRRLIDGAILESEKRFGALPKDDYSKLLGQLFIELEKMWQKERPGEMPVVLVASTDAGLFKTPYEVREDGGVKSGVVFVSADNAVLFENTVASRLEKGRAALVPAINEMLFGEVF